MLYKRFAFSLHVRASRRFKGTLGRKDGAEETDIPVLLCVASRLPGVQSFSSFCFVWKQKPQALEEGGEG
jgi:hypothetical protein